MLSMTRTGFVSGIIFATLSLGCSTADETYIAELSDATFATPLSQDTLGATDEALLFARGIEISDGELYGVVVLAIPQSKEAIGSSTAYLLGRQILAGEYSHVIRLKGPAGAYVEMAQERRSLFEGGGFPAGVRSRAITDHREDGMAAYCLYIPFQGAPVPGTYELTVANEPHRPGALRSIPSTVTAHVRTN